MHQLTELSAWERLLKRILWAQLGEIKGKNILDFGSGEGVTANHLKELHRVLKPGGLLSIVKHNRAGRVMQMAVLLDDMEKAHALLDGRDSMASKFGAIRYYEDDSISLWGKGLKCVDSFGIRTFWDLQQNQEKHGVEEWQEEMVKLEMRVSRIEDYRRIAFFHHLLFVKEE